MPHSRKNIDMHVSHASFTVVKDLDGRGRRRIRSELLVLAVRDGMSSGIRMEGRLFSRSLRHVDADPARTTREVRRLFSALIRRYTLDAKARTARRK